MNAAPAAPVKNRPKAYATECNVCQWDAPLATKTLLTDVVTESHEKVLSVRMVTAQLGTD